MADENITFAVGDNGGTSALIEVLKQLGITAEGALNLVQAATRGVAQSATDAAAAARIAQAGMADEAHSASELREELVRLGLAQSASSGRQIAAAAQAATTALQQNAGAMQQAANAAAPLNNNLRSLGAGYITGTQAAMAHRAQTATTSAAWQAAYTVTTSLTGAIKQTASSVSQSSGPWATLAQAVTGYYAATKLLHDVDVVDTVTRQIESLVPAGDAANKIFDQLGQTALATQSKLETVASGFSQIYGAIKEGGGTAAQAATIVDNLSRVFYATGTRADGPQRALHDFAEGMASGALQGQQLNSALRQAPAAMAVLGEALGINFEALTTHAAATDKARDRVDQLKASINSSTPGLGVARDAVDKWTNKIKEGSDKVNELKTKLNDTTYSAAQHTAQQKELTRAIEAQNTALPGLNKNLDEAKGKYAEASASVDAHKRSQLENAEAALKLKTALSGATLQAKLSSDEFTAFTHGMALGAGTVSGAFQNLETSFQLYLHDTGEASTITKAFQIVLGLIAQNLPTIVPLVGGLAAAWTLYNVGATVAATVTGILEAEYAGLILSVLGITAAILILTGKYGLFDDLINKVYASVTVATAKTLGHKDAIGLHTKSVLDNTAKLTDNTTEIDKNAAATTTATTDEASSWGKVATAIRDAFGGALDYAKQQLDAFASWASSIITSIIQGIGRAAAAAASALGGGGGGGAGAGASRDGSDFIVGGSGGTDSQLISMKVSPGERVTVTTPGQQETGSANPHLPKFRNGGYMDIGDGSYNVSYSNDNVGNPVGYGGPQSNLYKDSSGEVYTVDSINAAIKAAQDDAWEAATRAAQSAQAQAAAQAAQAAAAQAASSNQGAANTRGGRDGSYSGSSSSSSGSSSGGGSSSSSGSSTQKPHTGPGFDSIFGIQKPPGPNQYGQEGPISAQQFRVWSEVNSIWGPNPTYSQLDGHGGSLTAYQEAALEISTGRTVTQYMGARDGADFMVGGGSGADTRLLQLAVSPNEQVQVKTPMQQREANSSSGGTGRNVTVVQNFTGSDVARNSRSARQLASDARRVIGR